LEVIVAENGIDEFIKQYSTQSALLAGFAFAALTAITYDVSTSKSLITAFALCSSLSIALELITLFILGVVGVSIRAGSHDDYEPEIIVAYIAYFGGLLSFLAALALLAWVKVRPAAVPVTGIVILAVIAMAVSFWRMTLMDRD
jgi:hypothetical protein